MAHANYLNPTKCTDDIRREYSNNLAQFQWVFTLVIGFQALMGPIAGKLITSIGPRYTCLIACFLMTSGVFFSHFTFDNIYLFGLTLGIIFGCGFGIGFTGSIIASCAWWPNKKGLVTGLALSSIGFGITIFTSIQTRYINPKNIPLSNNGCGYVLEYDEVLTNISPNFVVLTGVLLALSLMGFILLFPAHNYDEYIKSRDKMNINQNQNHNKIKNGKHRKPKKTASSLNRYDLPFLTMTPTRLLTKQTVHYRRPNPNIGSINSTQLIMSESSYTKPIIAHKSVPASLSSKKKIKYSVHLSTLQLEGYSLNYTEQQIQYTLMDALKTVKFYQLFLIATLNYVINIFFLSGWKVVAQNYFKIIDDYFLSIIGNISGFCYGLGRVFWGLYFDYFDEFKNQFRIGMGTLVFLLTLCVVILPCIHIFFDDNRYLVLIFIPLVFFTAGSTYVTLPTTVSKTFGIEYAGVIFGALTMMELVSTITQSLLYKFFNDSIVIIFIIFTSMGIISFLLTMLYKTQNNKLIQLNNKN